MVTCLLDVNLLIALLWPAHKEHGKAQSWFAENAHQGWATCPITENGFIRITSGFAYPNLRVTPEEAAQSLRTLRQHYFASYQFWAEGVSLTDESLFELGQLTSSKQTTDIYLAGLAFHRRAKLATFDVSVPWTAVRAASAELVEVI